MRAGKTAAIARDDSSLIWNNWVMIKNPISETTIEARNTAIVVPLRPRNIGMALASAAYV